MRRNTQVRYSALHGLHEFNPELPNSAGTRTTVANSSLTFCPENSCHIKPLDDAGRNSWGVLKSKAKNESLTPMPMLILLDI
jgi:hypothetical protein